MKTIYIGLLSLFLHIALIGQVPCNEALDSINVNVKLDPDPDIEFFTEGYTTIDEIPFTPDPEGEGEYKKVITWVHGMNGDNSSWVHPSNYADIKYQVLPIRLNYNNFQSSLNTVRAGLKDDFLIKWEAIKDLTDDEGKQNSFAVAHSLGGIAIRGASETYPYFTGKVNGIITVSSPHGGSRLSYYVDTPAGPGDPELVQDLKDFASESCYVFGLGPIREYEQNNFTLGLLSDLGFLDIDKVLNGVCEVVTDIGIPLVINNIASMAVSELVPGGAALSINENVPDAHKMLFATSIVADPSAHNNAFKMFYSGQHSPNDRELWKADALTDEALKELDHNRNVYNAKYLEWRNHYDDKPWYKADWMCFNPPVPSVGSCLTYNDCKAISNGYNEGLYQFRKVSDYWEYIVGAREFYESDYGTCNYIDTYDNEGVVNNISEAQCNLYYDSTWEANSILTLVKDYDGLLTTESQSDWASCPVGRRYSLTPNNGYKGSDHLQIKNDSNTKLLVDFTLTGQGASFFGNN